MKKKEERIEDEEVILIKLYEMDSSTLSSTQSSSFINKEIDNLLKYIRFIKFPTQTKNIQTTTILPIALIKRGTRS